MTETEVKDFCRGKMADYKIPDYVRFMDSFPQTATGKVYRVQLKDQVGRGIATPP